jgi:hypothetical protein
MRTRVVAISTAVAIALVALSPATQAGARARRAAAALIRVEASIQEISADEGAGALGAELDLARGWLDDARSSLRAGRDKRAEALAQRLDAQIALLRAMLSAAGAEARAEAAERAALALADKIRELEGRYDSLVLEARGAELTSAFPAKREAPGAP